MKLKKGDTVIITAGKDRGRKGKIEKAQPKKNRVLVSGLNLYKKHVKAKSEKEPGGIVEIPRPLPVSNLALICPKCKKPTRIGYIFNQKGEKERICKKCKKNID